MARGRQGFALEFWKFGVYLMIPVGASLYYNDPQRQKQNADYWQFIKYPPSDPDKVREEVQARIEREKKMKEQRKEYLEQMQQLAKSAERSKQAAVALEKEETNALANKSSNAGWFSWLRFGQKKTE